jgi:hypothetical protein
MAVRIAAGKSEASRNRISSGHPVIGRPHVLLRLHFSALNFSDKSGSGLILGLPALVAKWQTRTLEVRVEKSMGVRVSPSALPLFSQELVLSVCRKAAKRSRQHRNRCALHPVPVSQ